MRSATTICSSGRSVVVPPLPHQFAALIPRESGYVDPDDPTQPPSSHTATLDQATNSVQETPVPSFGVQPVRPTVPPPDEDGGGDGAGVIPVVAGDDVGGTVCGEGGVVVEEVDDVVGMLVTGGRACPRAVAVPRPPPGCITPSRIAAAQTASEPAAPRQRRFTHGSPVRGSGHRRRRRFPLLAKHRSERLDHAWENTTPVLPESQRSDD